MEKYNANKLVSHEDVMKRYGVTASDLDELDGSQRKLVLKSIEK
ncbi:MAG: hypothetical protein ACLSXC_05585 [Beduini sp.]